MSDERRIPGARPSGKARSGGALAFAVAFGCAFALLWINPELSTGAFAALIGVAVVILVAGFMVLAVRQSRRFMRDNNVAIAMLARGEHQRALDVFWRLADEARAPVIGAVARHNAACALLRQGKLQHAIDVYSYNDASCARALRDAALYSTSAADLALAHALAGNLSDAEAWLARADERKHEASQPSFPSLCIYARAVLDCRTGKTGEAARMLDEKWNELESLLTGDNLRPVRVVRAFARAATDTRNAGIAESLLASSRPVYAGEYQHLGVAWPEMQQFLAANNLV